MRYPLMALGMLLGMVTSARAQISVGFQFQQPGISIGLNVPVFPELVLIPGYPVYYDPRGHSNYFFYDGLYWVYQGDEWYESSWYNGPWQGVGPEDVPLFVLRVPVRYYRRPPVYFSGWRAEAPPRWGEHWGNGWEDHRRGWDHWDHRSAPRAAPVPSYQRQYSGDRYPRGREQQAAIRSQDYRYQAREPVTRERLAAQGHPGGGHAAPPQHFAQPQPGQARYAKPQPAQPHSAQPPSSPPPAHPQPQAKGAQPASHAQGTQQAGQQDRSRERKPAPKDNGREDRNDERGPEHR